MLNSLLKYSPVLLLVLLLHSCIKPGDKQKKLWTVTLKKEDKNPYGTYLAYHSLQYYFPQATIDSLSSQFHYNNIDNKMISGYDQPSALVVVGLDFYVSENELAKLLDYVNSGNELVIFCSHLDDKIENLLNCYKSNNGYEELPLNTYNNGNNLNLLKLINDTGKIYGYEGHTITGYFYTPRDSSTADSNLYSYKEGYSAAYSIYASTHTDTLGLIKKELNFVRYKVGAGHITLHAAPLVLSNYFLLQRNNTQYLDGIWQTLPSNLSRIYWNEYYKRTADVSDFGILWRYPATRWALCLALISLLLYVLFEAKRRQRIIPIVTPLTNTSVSFVETVGRLYFNKSNHANMADKMVQHFLEWVRTRYYLNTNELNDIFIKQLTMKSGKTEANVRYIVDMIHELRLGQSTVDEAFLFQLYNTIQEFYKN